MDRGTYVAASAGHNQMRLLDIVNNNLANINTPGFKKQMMIGSTQSFDQTLAKINAAQDPYAKADHDRVPGAVHTEVITDFSLGPIKNTGSTLDLALLNPNQFFAVQSPGAGETYYTRAGNFQLNDQGQIVNKEGMTLSGEGGPINVGNLDFSITAGGQILSDGQLLGRVGIVEFTDPSGLERVGGTKFKLLPGTPAPTAVESPDIQVGALEMSNTSAITGVIDLIAASRGFEMYSKSAKSIDEMNTQAIQRLGSRNS